MPHRRRRFFPVQFALFAGFALRAFALDPGAPPGRNFDLRHWKLTLPTGPSHHADEIEPSRLAAGFVSPYFLTGPDGAMIFWSPINGTTTGNTRYPRSELREMRSDGRTWDWLDGDGIAVLTATCAVLQVPSGAGKTVIGQIHAKSIDLPLIKLAYDRGRVVALVKQTSRSDTDTRFPLARAALGEKISYEISLVGNLLTVTANGVVARTRLSTDWSPVTLYFKAGNYVQAAGGSATDGARVAFYSLRSSHLPHG